MSLEMVSFIIMKLLMIQNVIFMWSFFFFLKLPFGFFIAIEDTWYFYTAPFYLGFCYSIWAPAI